MAADAPVHSADRTSGVEKVGEIKRDDTKYASDGKIEPTSGWSTAQVTQCSHLSRVGGASDESITEGRSFARCTSEGSERRKKDGDIDHIAGTSHRKIFDFEFRL